MKSRLLLMLLSCSLSPAATLTVRFEFRENLQPSRHATVYVSDGINSLSIDLMRTFQPFENTLSSCGNYGVNPSPCIFTPGGVLNATNVPAYLDFRTLLVLNGVEVPDPNLTDYAITFFMNFTGGNPITVPVGSPWGPQALNADLNIAVMQISTGLCLFCEGASGTGTASGLASYEAFWPNYRFNYQASGEIVPESNSMQLALIGLAMLLATRIVAVHGSVRQAITVITASAARMCAPHIRERRTARR